MRSPGSESIEASPNTRVQRTRSSASPPRSLLNAPPVRPREVQMSGCRVRNLLVAGIIAAGLLIGCNRNRLDSPGGQSQVLSESLKSEILSLDHRYAEAWRQGDWATVASLMAPDYWGGGADFSWNLETLRQEFPKVKLLEYQNDPKRVQALGPNAVLLSYVTRMRETYDGEDISGRYGYSQIWVRRVGGWRLLVEQEIPLRDPS